MINSVLDFRISCDKCYEPLFHPEDSKMLSCRGQIVLEDSVANIKEVAKDYGWKITGSMALCPKHEGGK